MKIKRKCTAAEWHEMPDSNARFLIRPYPFSAGKGYAFRDDGSVTDDLWLQFDFCLQGWEGLEEEDGTEFKFTSENKRFLFDYVEEVRNFVFECARSAALAVVDELKN